MKVAPGQVIVMVEVIDATAIERRGAPDNAMDLIATLKQLLRHVRPVLPGDSGDQGATNFSQGILREWDVLGSLPAKN
jgi:hypothetical protein